MSDAQPVPSEVVELIIRADAALREAADISRPNRLDDPYGKLLDSEDWRDRADALCRLFGWRESWQ